jgi:hypothetical protein
MPVEWFRSFGIKFIADENEFDGFEFAGLENSAGVTFGLLHYNQSPPEGTTLMLPMSVSTPDHVLDMIRTVAKEFDIPMSSFQWKPARGAAGAPAPG